MNDLDDLLDDMMFSRLSAGAWPEMGLDAYRQWVREIQKPTPTQFEAFADYVAGARSWYKHLPLGGPEGAFQFYIDPHAGMDRLVLATGTVRLRERTHETMEFHYSWMTTAEYRERFGCLAFSCASGSRLFTDEFLDGEPVLVDHNVLFPELRLSDDVARVPPQEVLDAGRCATTALVHPRATAEWMAMQLARKVRKHDGAIAPGWADWEQVIARWRENSGQATDAEALAGQIGADPEFTSRFQQEKALLHERMMNAMWRMCAQAYPAGC